MTYAAAPTDNDWRRALHALGWTHHGIRAHDGDMLPDTAPQLSVWVLSDPYRGVPVVEVRDSMPTVTLEQLARWFQRQHWQLRLDLLEDGWTASCCPFASAEAPLLPDGWGTPMFCRQQTAAGATVGLLVMLDEALTSEGTRT